MKFREDLFYPVDKWLSQAHPELLKDEELHWLHSQAKLARIALEGRLEKVLESKSEATKLVEALVEEDVTGEEYTYERNLLPKTTLKSKMHRVKAREDSWCFTLRGKWDNTWQEYNEKDNKTFTLTNGRRVIKIDSGLQNT